MNTPPKPLVRWAAFASVLAGLLFAFTFLAFSYRARFTVPYVDDWSMLAALGQPWPVALFQPHNEHIMVVTRLLVWFDFWAWGWPGYATYLAALAGHAAVVVAFLWLDRDRSHDEYRLLAGMTLVTTCTTYALQGVVFPSASNFSLVFAFAATAIAALSHSITADRSGRWIGAASILSVLAMLSVSNGLAVPFVLAALSICLGLRRSVTTMFLGLGVVGGLGRFLLGGMPRSALAADPTAVVQFALATLAGPTASVSPGVAVVVGAVIATLCAWVLVRFARLPVKRPLDVFTAGNVAFVLASCAMTAVGRAQFDLSVAAESRYAELASLAWASLLYCLLPVGFTADAFGRFIAAALPAVSVLLLPAQVLVGRVWVAKADHLRVAALTLTTNVPDSDWMWRLHPLGRPLIEPALPILRARDVAFLRFPELGSVLPSTGPRQCRGALSVFEVGGSTEGLRVHGQLQEEGNAVLITDGASRTRGMAWPSPAVLDPRAGANDFVWAEIDVIAGRLPARGQWLGLTGRGTGVPYTAHLVDGERIVCTLPVRCCDRPETPVPRREIVVRGSLAEGHLDTADCSAVTGWVWDPVRPTIPLDVRVTASNGVEHVESASLLRSDLVAAGKGNGAHGFRVPGASLGLTAGTWTVTATVAATGVELAGSPITVTCP